jgi:short-subunit dehydrogenase
MSDPQSILITGASSGIGAALACAYARPGMRLVLTGRDRGRLAAVAESCAAAGAEAEVVQLDVTDIAGMADLVARADAVRPLDLVVANAGIAGGAGTPAEKARRIFAVNLDGVVNTVLPAASAMRARGRGQIAIMSSLASFVGYPGASAYCASKAAVRIWGEALRGELAGEGVSVTVICPGYVRSRLTEGSDAPMPLLMDAEVAVRLIRRRLARRPARIAFPWPLYFMAWLTGAITPALTAALTTRRGGGR